MCNQELCKEGERIDDLQRGGYRILQHPNRFCFGMDAVLLAGFAGGADGPAVQGETLLDMGTGTGIIPILMAARTDIPHITGLEIQEGSADMATRSVLMNNLENRISIVQGDIKEAGSLFAPASFDVVTCNPPYMIGGHGLTGGNEEKAIARHEVLCTFEDVAKNAAKVLKPGGHFFLVHRPFRMAEIITTLCEYKLEPKRLRLVYPRVDREPAMLLLEAVRGGNSRLTVEKPLIIETESGEYTEEIRNLYGF